MEIGTKLRFLRKRKSMTLADLAEGIISVSYLSKIENNDNVPDKEVISLLFDKLGMPAPEKIDSSTSDYLDEWYRVMIEKEKERASSMYEELSGVITEKDIELYIKFATFRIKYHLMEGSTGKAEEAIDELAGYEDTLHVRDIFYYYRFKALYHYSINDFQEALEIMKKAATALPTLLVEEWDLTDYHYFFGLVNSRLRKTTSCIFHINRALKYYNRNYHYERAAECHVLLGISHERIQEYEKAEEHFLLADKLARLLNNLYIKGLVSHNLGYLYSLQNNYPKAMEYFISSIDHEKKRNDNANDTLNTIHCIVIENYNAGYIRESERWIDEGLRILDEHSGKYSWEYYYHLHIYRNLIEPSLGEDLISFIEEEALPFFIEKEHPDSIIKYTYILGKHLKKFYKYKKANHYYEVSLRTIKNNHNLGGIIL
ncbi:helix-turn-helix domain-containing protein [Salimicrobium album]|uniref:Tetratricopeptide repeat-containing protein n=1 Tax=Salimicrobium album TaxID=50717 RepID=A0A1H3GCK7_9BACI|nr:helix-turn-helix transcriptional regulator [Salimicrobium album]SDY01001.1 Tetratricopeptide repeat-containing protein [Salimicrobium album]